MTQKKRFIQLGNTHIQDTVTGEKYYAPNETELLNLLNTLEWENNELKCALSLNQVDYIITNGITIDIPPYYNFENYQKMIQQKRDNYDEYW